MFVYDLLVTSLCEVEKFTLDTLLTKCLLINVLLSGVSRPILGDILVIVGTMFFATSNVGEVG